MLSVDGERDDIMMSARGMLPVGLRFQFALHGLGDVLGRAVALLLVAPLPLRQVVVRAAAGRASRASRSMRSMKRRRQLTA